MRRTLRLLAGAAVAATVLAAGTALTTSSASAADSVKIMPLGDSITDGLTVPGGYRIDLWQKLVAGGYGIDFVGSMSNGPSSLGDRDHEGHSGWTIAQIDANIVNWLKTYTPRTILLHIGTNDIYGSDPAGAPARLSTLLDHITAQSPQAEVFVATIIPLSCCSVQSFNAQVPGIVTSKANAGKHVHLVNMYNALTTADLADGVHPNAGGYSKMATVWYNALLSVPGSLTNGTTTPTTAPTTPTSPPAGGSCTATITPGTVWGDRYNSAVTVSGSSVWTVAIRIISPQTVTTTWSAAFTNDGTTLTVKPNGSGNTFGFTTMNNGNSTGRPQVLSCTAA